LIEKAALNFNGFTLPFALLLLVPIVATESASVGPVDSCILAVPGSVLGMVRTAYVPWLKKCVVKAGIIWILSIITLASQNLLHPLSRMKEEAIRTLVERVHRDMRSIT